jgi:hypothetical protein
VGGVLTAHRHERMGVVIPEKQAAPSRMVWASAMSSVTEAGLRTSASTRVTMSTSV